VPLRLREALGKLIQAPAEDIILGNSASYGMHLVANGMGLRRGDEVLVVKGDFPATILPWLGLADRGVRVKTVEMIDGRVSAEEVARNLNAHTRVFCSSWVFSFYGLKIDLPSIGRVCHERGVKLVVNGSQALGTQPLDIMDGYVDALTSTGFKWLCGPYGTGFCWVDPAWRETFDYNQAYWLSMLVADDLKKAQDLPKIKKGLGARKYDVFGTANFFNFVPWTAALEYLLDAGIDRIKTHNDALVSRLIEGLDPERYELHSPRIIEDRSTIVILSHKEADKNAEIFETLHEKGICISLRNGLLRFAPHLYNREEEIDHAREILNGF
ncbi:MAG: aminotransferase class V-fold PLP-dependent enzyme, partial [Planctomycetes bacterium]|nr:aminotransferase class V-fold PLP-dependent enzyme [Planctomycetota bacterium]